MATFTYTNPKDASEGIINSEDILQIPLRPASISSFVGETMVKFEFKFLKDDMENDRVSIVAITEDDNKIESAPVRALQKEISDVLAEVVFRESLIDTTDLIKALKEKVISDIVLKSFAGKTLVKGAEISGSGFIYDDKTKLATLDGLTVNEIIQNSDNKDQYTCHLVLNRCFAIDNLLSYNNLSIEFIRDGIVMRAPISINKDVYKDTLIKELSVVIDNAKSSVEFGEAKDPVSFEAISLNISDDDSIAAFVAARRSYLIEATETSLSAQAASLVEDMFEL